MTIAGKFLTAFLLFVLAAAARAQVSVEDANKSNNPLSPHPAFNLHNFFAPDIYGSDAHSNDFLLRGSLPIAAGRTIRVPQLLRVTVPLSQRPELGGGYTGGLGDINLFDVFLFKHGGLELGIGPQLTLPTATSDELGTGKWQAGFAALIVSPTPKGILGGLIQWQASFAGDHDRTHSSTLTAQPFVIVNLPQAWYVRSTATWSFNLRNGDYMIPIGLGVGKVFKSGTTVLNFFIEPQWTVSHEGNGYPELQIFAGLNMTF